MTAMLRCLVGDIADELRAALPAGATPANDDTNVALVEMLSFAGLLDHRRLIALLLRRADEEQIAAAAKTRNGRSEARMLQGLVSDSNGVVSAAAMALLLARGRRRDRFGQCLVDFDDLCHEVAAALVHGISAALRKDVLAAHGTAVADQYLTAASSDVLQRHDPAKSIDALTASLVRSLDEDGRLEEELIAAAIEEGELAFVAEALARHAGVSGEVALDELLSGAEDRMMMLLRIAGVSRKLAARLLAGVGDLLAAADAGRAIALFDRFDESQVDAARNWLASDPAYRTALGALGDGNGQRAV